MAPRTDPELVTTQAVAHECRAINRTIARTEDWRLRDFKLIRQPERANDDNLATALA